jgi:geranylgeranyl diphosphate synthase, type I
MSARATLVTAETDSPEALRELLPDVRRFIDEGRPVGWGELDDILRPLVDGPLGPLAVLPLASCAAVGGDPTAAVPVAAAWEVLNLAIRILDDAQDQDRPAALWSTAGVPRAVNFAVALDTFANHLLARAPWSAERYRRINRVFIDEALRLTAGQDRDLRSAATSIEEYWRTMEDKNAPAFALACAAGALAGTDAPDLVECCRRFGRHLGVALQLFDDFEGLWASPGAGDLGIGKVTLPVLYGLTVDHAGREELQKLADQGRLAEQANRVRVILDRAGAREFVVWAALQERDRAVAAVAGLPGSCGVAVLGDYVTALFARVEEIMSVV